MANHKFERVECEDASAIVLLNDGQKEILLEFLKENPNCILDLILLPCDTEVSISFKVGGFTDRLKPIVFKTRDACSNP